MPEKPSLLDFADKCIVDVWAVFVDHDERNHQWPRLFRRLKAGFHHVEIWRYFLPGAWVRVDTNVSATQLEVYADPPWSVLAHLNPTPIRVQRQVALGTFRSPFSIGPETCVSQAAAFLGIRLPFTCRTPYQLFKHLRKLNEKAESPEGRPVGRPAP